MSPHSVQLIRYCPIEMSQHNIVVAVRVRPLSTKELPPTKETPKDNSFFEFSSPSVPSYQTKIISVVDKRAIIFDPTHSTEQKRDYSHGSKNRRKEIRYTFDTVLDESSTQTDVFEATCKPLIPKTLEGFNATVFAYGATGCGKTHTITGIPFSI